MISLEEIQGHLKQCGITHCGITIKDTSIELRYADSIPHIISLNELRKLCKARNISIALEVDSTRFKRYTNRNYRFNRTTLCVFTIYY